MKKRRFGKAWVWLTALALLGGAFFLVRRAQSDDPAFDPAMIVNAKRSALAVEIIETGKVEPREKVELKSKVAGQVAEVLVEEGNHVEKGQLLLVLDPTDYAREVARAEADVAQVSTAIDYARVNLDRKKLGVEGRVVPAIELDAASHEWRSKNAALRAARVSLEAARDRVRYTKILAPIDGTVIQRGIESGEVVTPGVQSTFDGKPLLTIADLSRLIVKVDLNQIDVARVTLGQAASVTFDALPGKSYEGKVTKIAPASVKAATKDVDVFPVEVELAVADGAVKPGMTGDVRIHLEAKSEVFALPLEAVVKEKGKNFVTTIVDEEGKQRTERVEVTLGVRNDREVEIVSGLVEGARVLIRPASADENETKL